MDEFTLTLNSPITEEQWDTIADVDFDHTNEITFHTKHGKQVKFVKRIRGRLLNEDELRDLRVTLDGLCTFLGCIAQDVVGATLYQHRVNEMLVMLMREA